MLAYSTCIYIILILFTFLAKKFRHLWLNRNYLDISPPIALPLLIFIQMQKFFRCLFLKNNCFSTLWVTEIIETKRERHPGFFFNSINSDLLLSHSPDSEILIFDWVPGPFSFPKTLFTSLWDRAVSFLRDAGLLAPFYSSHRSCVTEPICLTSSHDFCHPSIEWATWK